MVRCPACSHSAAADSRFCPHCGTALPAAEEAEHESTILAGSSILIDDEPSGSFDHGSFLPGTLIAQRYRIVALLGKGGMGEVYRADDLKLGQSVALKFLPASLADDARRIQRFHEEVRIARQVTHPNVCRVYDIGEVEGHTYLSMEYVDGENLASLLRRIGRVPRDKAVEIARQICAGLAAAHERGILHRDLKPANVMIDGRGKVRITDFGLAALADELSGAASRAGTPAYMAPEQLRGEGFTVASEVYSLGLLLYELFTGKRAFKADTLAEYTRLHSEVPPVAPSAIVAHVDPAIERVILQCLEKEQQKRPRSVLAVAAALPGGDPLAAALAAGETPSPELVAAAAPAESFPASVSLACWALTLAGIAAFPFLNDQVKLHAFAPLDKPPQVLVDRARGIAERLGYQLRPADAAFGFERNAAHFDVAEAYVRRSDKYQQGTARWAQLAHSRLPAIAFWYRQSPRHLVPTNAAGIVTFDDPPPIVPETIRVRLDPRGRLLTFQAVPPAYDSLGPSREPDWSALFREAQLSPARLRPVQPERLPPVYADRRAAWVGDTPDAPGLELRVEAAAYRGKPVFFEVAADGAPDDSSNAARELTALHAGQLINVALVLVCLAGAAALARRNLAQGRGDRRGARRVAGLVGGAFAGAWALRAAHVPGAVDELAMLAVAAGRSLLGAGVCWLLYIGLEPYVRQRWPDMLISWNRLLANRFRDPVIGRDILIGGLFGILGVLLTAALYFAPIWFGDPPPQPAMVPPQTFLGLRYELAQLLEILIDAVLEPMALLLLLLLLLVLVRRRRLAISALLVIVTGLVTLLTWQPGANVYANAAVYATLTAALLFLLLRFGLLAVIVAVFYILLLNSYPITAEPQAWYVGASYFALGVAGGLALYGLAASLAGQRPARPSVPSD